MKQAVLGEMELPMRQVHKLVWSRLMAPSALSERVPHADLVAGIGGHDGTRACSASSPPR